MKKLKAYGIKEGLFLAGTGFALSSIGDSIGSTGLSKSGQAVSSYVPIAINIGAGATVINMARGLKRRR